MSILDYPTLSWDGALHILDQRRLPSETVYRVLGSTAEVWSAIRTLAVRGAPAIGVAAAYGMVIAWDEVFLAEQLSKRDASLPEKEEECLAAYREKGRYLRSSRPTAVNLSWAVTRMEKTCEEALQAAVRTAGTFGRIRERLLAEAEAIHREDRDACFRIAENGLSLLRPDMGILTHCNAGALATTGYGTALAPLHLGTERGYGFRIYADETRPLLQGARLTTWELMKSDADVTLICDNMASYVMKRGWIDAVLVGCDRMAANGDMANKIGTSGLAVLAKEYGIPFYVLLPTSTVDLSLPNGEAIEIEKRDGEEIRSYGFKQPTAPEGVGLLNPAFDITDAEYITAVITERGIVRPPFGEGLRRIMED